MSTLTKSRGFKTIAFLAAAVFGLHMVIAPSGYADLEGVVLSLGGAENPASISLPEIPAPQEAEAAATDADIPPPSSTDMLTQSPLEPVNAELITQARPGDPMPVPSRLTPGDEPSSCTTTLTAAPAPDTTITNITRCVSFEGANKYVSTTAITEVKEKLPPGHGGEKNSKTTDIDYETYVLLDNGVWTLVVNSLKSERYFSSDWNMEITPISVNGESMFDRGSESRYLLDGIITYSSWEQTLSHPDGRLLLHANWSESDVNGVREREGSQELLTWFTWPGGYQISQHQIYTWSEGHAYHKIFEALLGGDLGLVYESIDGVIVFDIGS